MNRILSWRIDSGVYAYIYPVNDGKYIYNKIPENSPLWEEIIGKISSWSRDDYYSNFLKMKEEVETQYPYPLEWKEEYWGFVDDNAVGGVNIVLLSGGDGDGVGGSGIDDGPVSDAIEDFNEMIQSKLDKAREDIEKQNEEVKNFVEEKVAETIENARETIRETKEELDNVKSELTENLKSAQAALDKASALFDLSEGGISPNDIQNVLTTVDEYGVWINTYSGDIVTLKTDYDSASEKLGSIGEAEDVSDGFFTRFATSLNVVSGTVGNVETWMAASAGTVGNMASWYNTNAESATEAFRMINASASQISDVINYINGDEITVKMQNVMEAAKGEWTQEIKSETELGISNVERKMDAFSASIVDQITYLAPESAITSMGERMDAMDFEMEQWMTKTDSAMTTALDIRESWSAESGRLSTVANLVAETDSAGNVLYYVSGTTNDNVKYEKLVTITDRFNDNGERIFVDEVGYEYFEPYVYTHLSPKLASYIQQTASGITFSAMGEDGLTAAIKLAIENDKSIISMIADEVVIDANVIAKEIVAKKAILGGIVMDDGFCYSLATDEETGEPLFKFDGNNGVIYAKNANISGEIHASSGSFNGAITATSLTVGNNSIENYVKNLITDGDGNTYLALGEKYGNLEVSTDGLIIAQNAAISGTVYADEGYFAGELQATKGKIGGFELNENNLNAGLTRILSNNSENTYSFVSGFKEPKDEEIVLFEYYRESDGNANIGPFIYVNKEQTEYFLKDKDGNLSSKGYNKLSIIDDYTVFLNFFSVEDLSTNKPTTTVLEKYIKSPKVNNGSINYADFKAVFGNDYYYKYSNTCIRSDGTLYSKLLVADNGYFTGEIDATGVFNGDIYSNHGYLKNIILENPIFKEVPNLPNIVFMESLDNGTDSKKYDKISHNIKKVNKNGDDKGKYYIAEDDNRITIFSIKVKENDTIQLPVIKIELTRYTSGNKESKSSYVDLHYKLETTTATTKYLGGFYLEKNGGTQTKSVTTDQTNITVSESGIFSIILSYNIHLSTYSWLGGDKSMFNLKINSDSGIAVTPKNITKNLVIADNGLRYVTKNYVANNSGYGIEITTNGIKICRGDGVWEDL